MIENLPEIALQVLIAIAAILTVVISFMKTNSIRTEWQDKSKAYTALHTEINDKVSKQDKKLTEQLTSQDKKISSIHDRLDKHEKEFPLQLVKLAKESDVKFASKDHVENKLEGIDLLAKARYDSLKEDQEDMKGTLTEISQLLTDERTRSLNRKDEQIAALEKQLESKYDRRE